MLNDLFVQQSGRRKEVAFKLLSALEAYAWSLGNPRMALSVARDNGSAQRLYESIGWEPDTLFFMYHRFPQNR